MPTSEADHPITGSRRSTDSSRSLKAHILLVLMTLIWGSTFVLIKQALVSTSPLLFNAVRMSLAAILLAVFYRKDLLRLTRPAMWAGVSVGFFLFLGYAFQTTGLHLTTPSKSAFLTGVSTVLVPLLLILIWKAHINHWRAAGIVTAFAGLFFMTVPPGREGIADFANVNLGDLLTIACAFWFAFHIILIGRASQRFPFEQIAVLQMATAAVLTTVAVPVLERPHLQLSTTVVAAILVTGILGTAVAFTVQAWAQQFTPATHAALIFTLEPVFAWLTSLIVLNERLGLRAGIGALLILAGVLISELLGNVARPEQALAEG
jgi:drug/metabolite transporter (DMT)-like permease